MDCGDLQAHLRAMAEEGRRVDHVYDEMLLIVDADKATPVDRIDLSDLELRERAHLQEWILANPAVLGPGVEIVTSEYDRWQTAEGDPVLDRLDILGIDPDGRIVVAELKRGVAPHTVYVQAINYAAMVSRLTPDDVAELYSAARRRDGEGIDAASALTVLTTEKLLTAESIRRPRIVLVASDFPASVTSAVVWLNEQSVDLSLIRYRPYRLDDGQGGLIQQAVPGAGRRGIHDRPPARCNGRCDAVPDVPWDEASLRLLEAQANPATLALLDLCSAEEASSVGVKDVAEEAGGEAAIAEKLAAAGASPPRLEIGNLASRGTCVRFKRHLGTLEHVDVLVKEAGLVAGQRGSLRTDLTRSSPSTIRRHSFMTNLRLGKQSVDVGKPGQPAAAVQLEAARFGNSR
jgi:hypothetical protein